MAAGLVLPYADTAAMNAHLAEIAGAVAPGAHAVLVLDGAGWHGGKGLVVPDAITLLTLPPYAPELNPVENVWQYLRANWLAISVFDGYDAIVTACCAAWNRLLGRGIGLGMARAHGEPAISECRQILPTVRSCTSTPNAPLDPAREVAAPPAHHPVPLGIGPGLDPSRDLRHLRRRKLPRPHGARRLASPAGPSAL